MFLRIVIPGAVGSLSVLASPLRRCPDHNLYRPARTSQIRRKPATVLSLFMNYDCHFSGLIGCRGATDCRAAIRGGIPWRSYQIRSGGREALLSPLHGPAQVRHRSHTAPKEARLPVALLSLPLLL